MTKGLPRSLAHATVGSGILSNATDGSAVAGTGVTGDGTEMGTFRKEVITLDAVEIALTDEAGVVAYGGVKIFDFAEGAILLHGAVADLTVVKDAAGVNDDWDGDFGLGTVTAGNNAALATTEQNIVPTTATPQAVAGATTAQGKSTATESGSVLDGTTTPVDVYLNFLVDDADQDVTTTATNLVVSGTVTLFYTPLGDL